jgi:3-keto-disaccharide hydrolase
VREFRLHGFGRGAVSDDRPYRASRYQRPDPSYGTGAITRYVEINPMPKAGGKWNTFEITAKGRDITVLLNGEKTAELRNGMFDEGWSPCSTARERSNSVRCKSSLCRACCNRERGLRH